MSRPIITAAAIALLLPAVSSADSKLKEPSRVAVPEILPAASFVQSRPSKCKSCGDDQIYPNWMGPGPVFSHPNGYGAFGDELRSQLLWDYHECAPDGCIKPIGCGNFWTELKFIFGSCRQFHGTAESTVGHHYNTRDRFATPYR